MFTKSIIFLYKSVMELIALYSRYFIKMATVIQTSLTKPIGIIIFAPTVTVISYHSTVQNGLLFLAGVLTVDFITGVLVSKKKKKKYERENPQEAKKTLLSSEKMRLSLVKSLTYIAIILGVFAIEKIFFIKSFKWESVTDLDLTGTIIIIAVCSGIELWSIVMENVKELGFDLEAKILKVAKGGWKLFGAIKNGDEEDDYQHHPRNPNNYEDPDIPTH